MRLCARVVAVLRLERSLVRFDAAIDEIVAGNYGARFRPASADGLEVALSRVNALADLLAETRAAAIRSEAARKSLLSDIAHDIRTPLTSIIGYADALRDGIASGAIEQDEYAAVVAAKSRALKAMVEDVFELAKLDADEITMTIARVDLAEAAREAVIEFLPTIRAAEVALIADIPDGTALVFADGLSLARVMRNLIQNALDHAAEGKYLRVAVVCRPGSVSFEVADRGPGIPEAELARVFTRLYRRDPARGPRSHGSGLGLAIVQSLALKNGASVAARSEPGGETVFSVDFPSPP